MAALIAMHGQRFGRWTVLDRVGTASGHATWLCRCDCGAGRVVAGSELKAGRTKSCTRCASGTPASNRLELSGQRFGLWTVLNYAGRDAHDATMWLCRCDCGIEKTVRGKLLKAGRSTRCRRCATPRLTTRQPRPKRRNPPPATAKKKRTRRPRSRATLDIDEVAVQLACAGDPVRISIPERGLAVKHLTQTFEYRTGQLTTGEIARRLRQSRRNVIRYKHGQVKHARISQTAAA